MRLRKITKQESEYLFDKYGHGMDVIEDFILVVALLSLNVAYLLTEEDANEYTLGTKIAFFFGIFLLVHVATTYIMRRNKHYYTKFYCCVFNVKNTNNRVLSYIAHDMITMEFRAGTKKREAIIMVNEDLYTEDVMIVSKKNNMKSLLFAYPYKFQP